MKRKWKILLAVAAALVVALLAVVLSLDSIVRAGVESGAASATGTRVTVGQASLSLFGGTLELSDVRVANPQGFPDADMMQVERVFVSLRPRTLFGDVVDVREIILEGPILRLHQRGAATNMGVVMANIERTSPDDPGQTRLRLASMSVLRSRVEYDVGLLGSGAVSPGDIVILEVSTEDAPAVTLASVIQQVLVAMASRVAGGIDVPPAVRDALQGVFGGNQGRATGLTPQEALRDIDNLLNAVGVRRSPPAAQDPKE